MNKEFCPQCGQNFGCDERLSKALGHLEARNVACGGHAFPVSYGDMESGNTGMTLRDYFAAKALPALLADALRRKADGGLNPLSVATEAAYAVADEMLKMRGDR
jgi:hypothetical protein